MNKTRILDCTLRDGSFAIDFQFTLEQTRMICKYLEESGIELIEIGHGHGFNASNKGQKALHNDEEYLTAANEVLKKSKFGMFQMPGISKPNDIDLGVKYNMNFVRIGTNVTEIEKARDYIKYSKDNSLFVCSNLIKSYAVSPSKFIEQAKKAEEYGADVIYLVDSAGGMLPEEVKKYIKLMKKNLGVQIGFHGHNNLNLAITNTLEAMENGADIIDTTLRGIGRDAGNAQTEIMISILEKKGYNTSIDLYKTMEAGEKFVAPLIKSQIGIDSISVISGFSQFHSSFLPLLSSISRKYSLDIKKLIVEVCKIDKVNVSEELVETVAKRMSNEN